MANFGDGDGSFIVQITEMCVWFVLPAAYICIGGSQCAPRYEGHQPQDTQHICEGPPIHVKLRIPAKINLVGKSQKICIHLS